MSSKAKALRAARIEKIRENIAAYDADPVAKPALDRIASSRSALEALADMQLTDGKLRRLVEAFAKAVQIKIQLRLLLAQEEAFLEKVPRLTGAVADLRSFVKDISAQREDGIRATISMSDEERSWFLQALYEIGVLIKHRERIAHETPGRIGATRKAKNKTAEENVAIGWAAASVLRIVGRPCIRQSAVLVGTLLGIREVSEDRLRRALRNHTEREWRLPLSWTK